MVFNVVSAVPVGTWLDLQAPLAAHQVEGGRSSYCVAMDDGLQVMESGSNLGRTCHVGACGHPDRPRGPQLPCTWRSSLKVVWCEEEAGSDSCVPRHVHLQCVRRQCTGSQPSSKSSSHVELAAHPSLASGREQKESRHDSAWVGPLSLSLHHPMSMTVHHAMYADGPARCPALCPAARTFSEDGFIKPDSLVWYDFLHFGCFAGVSRCLWARRARAPL